MKSGVSCKPTHSTLLACCVHGRCVFNTLVLAVLAMIAHRLYCVRACTPCLGCLYVFGTSPVSAWQYVVVVAVPGSVMANDEE